MKLTHTLLAALAATAWGAIGAHASMTATEDLTLEPSRSAPAQLAQADGLTDQFAWALTDEPGDDEGDDEGDDDEAASNPRAESAEPAAADRPARRGFGQPPGDRDQIRDLFQRLQRARSEGSEEEIADLARQLRERRGGGPPFGPGPLGRRPGFGPPEGGTMGPPLGRGPGAGRGTGGRDNRGGPPDQAEPREAPPADQPAEANRRPAPRPNWDRPDRPRREGPPTATARRGRRGGPAGPNAPEQGRRRMQQQGQRLGPGPWGGPPAWQRPGQVPFRGPAAGARPGAGPRPAAPRMELQQLRDEMRQLREAIEALTKEVEAARQSK